MHAQIVECRRERVKVTRRRQKRFGGIISAKALSNLGLDRMGTDTRDILYSLLDSLQQPQRTLRHDILNVAH